MSASATPTPPSRAAGLLAAFACFTAWGFVPVYWKQIPLVPAGEMVAHRILWSLLFLSLVLAWRRGWAGLWARLDARSLAWSAVAGVALTANWWIFLWAVNSGHVVDVSLGYFLMPLVHLGMGLVFFQERLRPGQWVAVGLAVVGLGQLLWTHGSLPWIAISLCSTWGLYGALRKVSRLDSLPGLIVETAVLAPLAAAWVLWSLVSGQSQFWHAGAWTTAFLVGGGPLTALPLLWFSFAARLLPMSTIGFFQYLGPSISFLLGVYLYREPFSSAKLATFACVWSAIAVASAEAIWQARRQAEPSRRAPAGRRAEDRLEPGCE